MANVALKSPIVYQGNLFVVRGYEVLMYSVKGENLVFENSFAYSNPIESIRPMSKGRGILVTTDREFDLIAGGPDAVAYYQVNLAKRTPEAFVDDNLVLHHVAKTAVRKSKKAAA